MQKEFTSLIGEREKEKVRRRLSPSRDLLSWALMGGLGRLSQKVPLGFGSWKELMERLTRLFEAFYSHKDIMLLFHTAVQRGIEEFVLLAQSLPSAGAEEAKTKEEGAFFAFLAGLFARGGSLDPHAPDKKSDQGMVLAKNLALAVCDLDQVRRDELLEHLANVLWPASTGTQSQWIEDAIKEHKGSAAA